jgi:hypothetical protein
MERTAIRSLALAAAAGLWTLLIAGDACGAQEEFRVESKVFAGSDKEPRNESTTIFIGGVVYDYVQKPSEIIVLDPGRGRFILLDPGRRVRSELTTQEVLAINDNFRSWAGTQTEGYLKFLASPKFDQNVDEKSGELVFESPWVTYRIGTMDAESDAVAEQYREFSDWCARLNTRLNPGYKLASARLEINEALAKRRQMPQTITLAVQPKRGLFSQKTVLRSEHQLIRQLVESDRDRITQTSQFMAIFQPVSFEEYQKRLEP